ncbi:flagellar motor switch protein FliM, partial [Serratia bockelmannii]|nr:flagellar motor switch protein FliM [Serratia bockelmannii]
MGDSILSQAEIDALLNGDSDSAEVENSSKGTDGDIRPYD